MALRLLTLLGVAAVLTVTPTAYAATGSPPVTNPDRVVLRAGEATPVDVTANDSDPDGYQLEVCRVGAVPRGIEAQVEGGHLFLAAKPKAHGTYTLTYYACDDSYLTAGTLTVKVGPPAPTFDIVPVADAPPGRIRLVNTYKSKTFHCQWHALDSDKVQGKATVQPLSTVVIQVHEAELEIDCTSPHSDFSAVFLGDRMRAAAERA